MGSRNPRSLVEGLRSLGVVLDIHIVDKAKVVVEVPFIGIVLNAVFHQLNGAIGLACTPGRRGRQKTGAEVVRRHQMRIQCGSNLQQRGEQIVVRGVVVMAIAEILNGARPVNVSEKAFVAEAGALQNLGRTDVKNFFQGGLGANLVDASQHQHASDQATQQTDAGGDCDAMPGFHFRFLCSKMRTAPLRAIAAYSSAYKVLLNMSCWATGCS